MFGDIVVCCNVNGQVIVNGKVFDEWLYLYFENGEMVKFLVMEFWVIVFWGWMFVLGDYCNVLGDLCYYF